MDFIQMREHIICCSSILPPPPPPPPSPLTDGMITIMIFNFSIFQAVVSSVHAIARESSLLCSVQFLWQKVPRRSEAMPANSSVSRPVLPEVDRTSLRNQTFLLKCEVLLNSPYSERSHMKAQISNQPISCISQLLLSNVTWLLPCGGDPQVDNFSHPNSAEMQIYI